jgi:hypothetical protein
MIDRHALEPRIAEYIAARQAMSGPVRDAIQQLHDKLDAEQRADFADALEANMHRARREITSGAKLSAFAAKVGLTDKQVQELRQKLQKITPGLEG